MVHGEKPKILIVDDQARNLDVLDAMLGDMDCTLIRATTSDEALLCLVRHEFAALVLDIKMPGMSGLELATLVKQRKRSQHVPILFLTAHSVTDDDVLRGYGAGAVDYLSKPINAEILRSKIGVFVELYRKTRELVLLNETLESRVRERTAALSEARDEAERQSRLKDEFLATLSHELRTPMNAILGWLSILESGKPIREVNAALAVIARNARIQARLIDDLLDMNRLMIGNVRLEVVRVDIGSLLQTTLQSLQPAADARRVQLIASVGANVGEILADSRRLQQILWNLVHNAIKFSVGDGRVEVHVHRVADHLQVVVKDNGQGILPEFLPHVFERFRQQDASVTRIGVGLGLGLSIAKHLVELHGGTIDAASPGDGQGATFTVRIPAMPPATSTSTSTVAPLLSA
jgi:signal transduction histidine kinase